jgi:hypothetical protein
MYENSQDYAQKPQQNCTFIDPALSASCRRKPQGVQDRSYLYFPLVGMAELSRLTVGILYTQSK